MPRRSSRSTMPTLVSSRRRKHTVQSKRLILWFCQKPPSSIQAQDSRGVIQSPTEQHQWKRFHVTYLILGQDSPRCDCSANHHMISSISCLITELTLKDQMYLMSIVTNIDRLFVSMNSKITIHGHTTDQSPVTFRLQLSCRPYRPRCRKGRCSVSSCWQVRSPSLEPMQVITNTYALIPHYNTHEQLHAA